MKRREIRKALLNKLDCEEREGRKHTNYRFIESDMCIATTALPRGNEIRDKLFGIIAAQLHINSLQLRGIVVCTHERDDYIQMLKKNQVLLG